MPSTLSLSIERYNDALWRRINASTCVPLESLGAFRWIYGLYSLLFAAPFSAWIDEAPRAFFDPPRLSLAALAAGFPPAPTFLVLDIGMLLALTFVTVGWHTRSMTIALLLLRIFAAHFQYSFGKIDHDILANAILGCMALADWGRCYSIDAARRRDENRGTGRGVCLFAVILAFGMLTAGAPKALHWIDFDLRTSGVLSWYYPNAVSLGRTYLLAPYVGYVPTTLWEAADCVAPLLELASGIALLHSRRAWLAWILAATTFHLVNALFLNIAFTTYVVSYACFVNLAPLGARLERIRVLLTLSCGAVALWHVYQRCIGVGSQSAFVSDPAEFWKFKLLVAIPVCAIAIAVIVRELVRPGPPRLQENT